MDSVGAYEAKTHLSRLLERVAKGESITITKHGVPVAVLSPVKKENRMSVEEAIAGIKEIGSRNTLGGLSIKELIEEGRR